MSGDVEAWRLVGTEITRLKRERDEVWCRALMDALDPKDAERVLVKFNAIRPDRVDRIVVAARRLFGEEKR